MKLILTAPVDHLGIPGEIVEVKDGYGRNYLLPRGFAIKWTRGAEKQIEGIKRARDAREIRSIDHAKEIRTQLEALTVRVPGHREALVDDLLGLALGGGVLHDPSLGVGGHDVVDSGRCQ